MSESAYHEWIDEFLERLADYLNLAGWTITAEFTEREEKDACNQTYAQIISDVDYLRAIIVFYPPAESDFNEGNIGRLAKAVVHEFAHIFYQPLVDFSEPHVSPATEPFFRSIVEQQTQKLTMVLWKSLPEDLIPPRQDGIDDSTRAHDSSGTAVPAPRPSNFYGESE